MFWSEMGADKNAYSRNIFVLPAGKPSWSCVRRVVTALLLLHWEYLDNLCNELYVWCQACRLRVLRQWIADDAESTFARKHSYCRTVLYCIKEGEMMNVADANLDEHMVSTDAYERFSDVEKRFRHIFHAKNLKTGDDVYYCLCELGLQNQKDG